MFTTPDEPSAGKIYGLIKTHTMDIHVGNKCGCHTATENLTLHIKNVFYQPSKHICTN